MYSNNILNFQASTTILNARTKKKVWNLFESTTYVCMCVCARTRLRGFINVSMCVCVYLWRYMNIYLTLTQSTYIYIYIYMCVCVCVCVCVQDLIQDQFFKLSLNSDFYLPRPVAIPRLKSLSYYLPISERIIGFIPFPRVLDLCEMKIASS